MKKLLYVFNVIVISGFTICAQSTHSVTLIWQDTLNPIGTTYNVYRTTNPCNGTNTFASIINGLTTMTYIDNNVVVGPYCYYVTAMLNGVESDPSITADAKVKPFPPPKPGTSIK